MLPLFDTSYSVKQLYDMLEQLDVYDAIKKMAYDRVKSEANKK